VDDRDVLGSRLAALSAGAVAVAALILGRNTLMPGVGFWDTAEFQTFGPVMGTGHPTGYPTYAILGWLAGVVLQPFGDPAFRMNLFSALSVAVACGLTVLLVRRLVGLTLVGMAAGLGLAMTPIVWKIATHADGHALHLALLAMLFVLLVGWEHDVRGTTGVHNPAARDTRDRRDDRKLVAATFIFGLSLGNHSLTLLLIPAVGLYVLAVDPSIWRRPRLIGSCLAVLVVTTVAVYLELPLRAGPFRAPLVYGTPDTLAGFQYVVLAEQFRGAIVDPFGDLGGKLNSLVGLAVGQFGPLAPFIPVAFVASIVIAPRYALLSGVGAAVTLFFDASYVNAEITRYYIGPAFIAWTWLGVLGGGAARLARSVVTAGALRLDMSPDRRPSVVGVALAAIAATLLIIPSLNVYPTRAAAIDESQETSAQTWLADALSVLKPDAVVVSWWSFSTSLWYAQRVEHRREDIDIIDDRTRLDENLGGLNDVIDGARSEGRPVYVIRLDPNELEALRQRYALQPAGTIASNLLEVLGPTGASR
jgi:hypothetical protein